MEQSIADNLASRIAALDAGRLPAPVRETCERLLIDVIGLCVVARRSDYVGAALAAWPDTGPATAIGHARLLSAAGAAFVNGTAAHGEDFDDTFEGGPVHAGAVIVPAVLAAAEQEKLDGAAVAPRRRGGRGGDLPAEPGRAQGRAQGGLPPDGGVRRHGRGRRRRRGAEARRRRGSRMRWASPAPWRAASSSTWPTAAGPSACIRAGRRSRACAPRCWPAPASRVPAPSSRARTACSTPSPTRARATGRRCSTASASAGSPRRWPSSPTRAAP